MIERGYVVKFRGQECRFGDLEAPRTIVTLVGAGEGEVFMLEADARAAAKKSELNQRFVKVEPTGGESGKLILTEGRKGREEGRTGLTRGTRFSNK
jgi:hypothetical protein